MSNIIAFKKAVIRKLNKMVHFGYSNDYIYSKVSLL